MASINTNYGAMVAAQSFAATSRELDKVQNRVTTGLKISSAKDNGAVWAIANTQKANAKALDATMNNLLRQQSIADVGIAAGETVMAGLSELKELAAAIAANGGVGAAATLAYRNDYDAIVNEIGAAITAATFDGTAALSLTTEAFLEDGTNQYLAADVDSAMSTAASALQTIGSNAKSYERQLAFNHKLQDALEAGAGNLVDADLAKESAKLTALQTKQQLGVQALSIANSSSSALLGLFR